MIGSTAQLSWSADTMAQRRLDGLRLLRQAIPVTGIAFVDASGIVKLRASRVAMDTVDDLSHQPKFTQTAAHKVYHGPAYLRHDMIYITLSVAGPQRENGVSVAEVNLSLEKFLDL
jgi:two-component system, NtrC family, sensor kinase